MSLRLQRRLSGGNSGPGSFSSSGCCGKTGSGKVRFRGSGGVGGRELEFMSKSWMATSMRNWGGPGRLEMELDDAGEAIGMPLPKRGTPLYFGFWMRPETAGLCVTRRRALTSVAHLAACAYTVKPRSSRRFPTVLTGGWPSVRLTTNGEIMTVQSAVAPLF